MILSDEDFFNYARKHYDNPTCRTIEEFTEDINRFKYLRKVLQRYVDGNDVDPRLIINHVMVLYNVFDRDACTKMLFFKVEKSHFPIIKTILTFLNHMPDAIPELGISNVDLPLDEKMVKYLRSI